jgi:hypothetical protein
MEWDILTQRALGLSVEGKTKQSKIKTGFATQQLRIQIF